MSQNSKKSGFHMPYSKFGKILLNLLVTVIIGFIYFYVALPAINLQSGEFYSFLSSLDAAGINYSYIERGTSGDHVMFIVVLL